MGLKSYLTYRKRRVNAHGIHSPFVFDFYNEVILKAKSVDDASIKRLRDQLLKDQSIIDIVDLGAGSKKNNSDQRKISEIARVSGIKPKYGKLLKRIVEHYKIENILELGTSLGLGTAYLASNPSVGRIVTIEGSPEIAAKASENFKKLGLSNIEKIEGNFDDILGEALHSFDKLDLIYIDGNHTYEATIRYFEQVIELAHDDTFLIFDDIHWSEGMEKAWDEISASDKVNLSIDLFRMGIVMKRSGQAKEHFVIKY